MALLNNSNKYYSYEYALDQEYRGGIITESYKDARPKYQEFKCGVPDYSAQPTARRPWPSYPPRSAHWPRSVVGPRLGRGVRRNWRERHPSQTRKGYLFPFVIGYLPFVQVLTKKKSLKSVHHHQFLLARRWCCWFPP